MGDEDDQLPIDRAMAEWWLGQVEEDLKAAIASNNHDCIRRFTAYRAVAHMFQRTLDADPRGARPGLRLAVQRLAANHAAREGYSRGWRPSGW
jgi:hypothetical protein